MKKESDIQYYDEPLIRFDWAVKRILRDKANFGVLEGLITVLLNEKITITEMLESESNQDDDSAKFNRVDIKALDGKGDIIIVEIQQTRELYYLERILFGVSKAVTEHISLGGKYDEVKKVYSINILYFDLGKGSDYLYHGTTSFVGVHTKDTLKISVKEKEALILKSPSQIFPEYYLIRVNQFNEVAKTPLEEWMEFLKSNKIQRNTTTPGLQEARERLRYMQMSKSERAAYDNHLDAIATHDSVLAAAHAEGMEAGRAAGRAEGINVGKEKERQDIARKMKQQGMPLETIVYCTGLSENEIKKL